MTDKPFTMPVEDLLDFLQDFEVGEYIGLDEIEVFWSWKEEETHL